MEEYNENTFMNYLDNMSVFCPYITPAINKGLIENKNFHFGEEDYNINEIEFSIFWITVSEIERFRRKRNNLSKPNKLLLNFNLIFTFSNEKILQDNPNMLEWTHFLAKNLYTSYGITFGKFHKNAHEIITNNKKMKSPPYTHFPIRSSVVSKDIKFFDKTPYLIKEVTRSYDDGSSPLKNITFKELNHLTNKERRDIYKKLVEDGINLLYTTPK